MMHLTKRFAMVVLLVVPAFAQRDFLTDTEIDQVREIQEPVARIKLYLAFAKQRLDQLQSAMSKDRPGRSGEVRQLLGEYAGIIDAIDTVSDDALGRKADVTLAPALIAEGEKKFLDQLEKIQASAPRDLEMYDFELKEAIAATGDSLDLTKQDLSARGQAVESKAAKEKKEVANVNAGGEATRLRHAGRPVRGCRKSRRGRCVSTGAPGAHALPAGRKARRWQIGDAK